MQELISFIPNLTSIVIPTNWYQTDIDAVSEILKIIDNNISPRETKDRTHFHLQLSIDGLPNTKIFEQGHNASWVAYKNNFDQLCEKLKILSLKNVVVHLAISATTAYNLWFESFKSYEDLAHFFIEANKAVKYVKEKSAKIPNEVLQLNTEINMPHFALPHTLNVEEATELTRIVRLIDYVLYQENIEHGEYERFVKEFQGPDTSWPLKRGNHECPEANQGTITVLPDGTIAFCPSVYMEHQQEYQEELLEQNKLIPYKDALLFSQHVFNPLTITEKELEQYLWYVLNGGIKDSYFSIQGAVDRTFFFAFRFQHAVPLRQANMSCIQKQRVARCRAISNILQCLGQCRHRAQCPMQGCRLRYVSIRRTYECTYPSVQHLGALFLWFSGR